MLHARELADRIGLTNGAKTRIFNPDGVFGIHTAKRTGGASGAQMCIAPVRSAMDSICKRKCRDQLLFLIPDIIKPENAFQNEIETNIEFGEAVLTMLKRKAERQLEVISPAHDEGVVEFWRALLDMQTVQAKLGRERHRLSVFRG